MELKILEKKKEKKKESFEFTFDLLVEGISVGFLKIIHKKKPINLFFISKIEIYKDFRNRGFSKKIVLKINDYILQNNAVGVLFNSTKKDSENHWKTHGLYARNGWKQVGLDETSYMYFSDKELTDLEQQSLMKSMFV
jgi:hypothetical protein